MYEYREKARELAMAYFEEKKDCYDKAENAFNGFCTVISVGGEGNKLYSPTEHESRIHVSEIIFDDGVLDDYANAFGHELDMNIGWWNVDRELLRLACVQIADEVIADYADYYKQNDYNTESIERIKSLLLEIAKEYQNIDRGGYLSMFVDGRHASMNNRYWELPENKGMNLVIDFVTGKEMDLQ